MLFTSLVLAVLGFTTAAPVVDERQYLGDQVIDGQVARAYCTDEVKGWEQGPLRGAYAKFCEKPGQFSYGGRNNIMDISHGNYFLQIINSQGGSYEPCNDAFQWITSNCVSVGKIGVYMTNANEYKIVPRSALKL